MTSIVLSLVSLCSQISSVRYANIGRTLLYNFICPKENARLEIYSPTLCTHYSEEPPAVAQLDLAAEAVERPESSEGTILYSNDSPEIGTSPVYNVPPTQNTNISRQHLRETACATIGVTGPSSHCREQRFTQATKNMSQEYEELLTKDAEMLEKDITCLKQKVNAIENATQAAQKISDAADTFSGAIDEMKLRAIQPFDLRDEVSQLTKHKWLLEIENLKASNSHKNFV